MVRERKEKEEHVLLKGVLENLDEEVDRLRGMLEGCRPGGEKREGEGEEKREEKKMERKGNKTEEKRKKGVWLKQGKLRWGDSGSIGALLKDQ
jgi:hypothetical protein